MRSKSTALVGIGVLVIVKEVVVGETCSNRRNERSARPGLDRARAR